MFIQNLKTVTRCDCWEKHNHVVIYDEWIKENVAFDDIASSEWQTVWTFGDELFWFRKAWTILEKYGLTEYSDKREYGKVLTRILTLI